MLFCIFLLEYPCGAGENTLSKSLVKREIVAILFGNEHSQFFDGLARVACIFDGGSALRAVPVRRDRRVYRLLRRRRDRLVRRLLGAPPEYRHDFRKVHGRPQRQIMVSTAFLTLFALGMFGGQTGIALFCAVISMSREFFVSGIRMLAASKGIVLAAERMGKYKAGFQMYSLGAVICAKALDADFSAGGSLLRETVFSRRLRLSRYPRFSPCGRGRRTARGIRTC